MTEQTCVTDSCGRPVHDARVCVSCGDVLAQALGDVTALSDELDTTLSRQTGRGIGRESASPEKPLPYDVGASEAADVLRNTLVMWVRELITEEEPWPKDTLADISRWLLASVEDIRQREDGGEAVDEIGSAVRHAQRAIDRAAERVYAGPCGADLVPVHPDDPKVCAAELFTLPDAVRVKCWRCDTVFDTKERQANMLISAEGHLATTTEAAAYLSRALRRRITPSMIRGYVARGRIVPHGENDKRHPLYRIGDVIEAVTDQRHAEAEAVAKIG